MIPRHYVTDWSAIFADVRQRGVGIVEFSRRTGIPVRTLEQYRAGDTSPRHARGEVIIEFWCEVTTLGRNQRPLTAEVGSADTACAGIRQY